ncbi:MAG: GNAT family N-acetyltransferase [Gammaproteobacteria bacterium]|nr:GNAT family N-acetyltransferase [Gammaproteobacteria bacterium]NNL99289.1 GNAT family N-acetyltransferase [Gammaproteobacteria bacterium]
MPAPSTIDTERLTLRRPTAEDLPAIFRGYASDPAVTRYLGWPVHGGLIDTRAFLELSDAEWRAWPAGPYLITARDDGRILGSTCLAFETPHRAETGYVLARDAWGRGYASEALAAMVQLAGELGVARLYALCHCNHDASSHVLEKCDFRLEGTLRAHSEFPNLAPGEPQDVLCYARILIAAPPAGIP